MQVNIENAEQRKKYFSALERAVQNKQLYAAKYLDFGVKVVRVLCYTPEIIIFLKQHLSFVLRDNADHFDETIVFWKEENIQGLIYKLDDRFNPKINLRLRVDALIFGRQFQDVVIMDKAFSNHIPLIKLSSVEHLVEAYDTDKHCCYYAVDNLDQEEFIKRGHLFVQQLNVLLKSDTVNLTHGAVFGYNGQGVLLCARGQRGKSTLTVHSMVNGCEYVSDDYQLLEKRKEGLYAYPLYSIITLSPEMYEKMGSAFKGEFCSKNARKDKGVFNIDAYHNQFKIRYPIKLCLFPEIVSDECPTIVPCTSFEKGRAIVQFIHSTVLQMRDLNNHQTIAKLLNMIKELPFYKFNLSPKISENTEYLYQFLKTALSKVPNQDKLPPLLLDITFDLANILDTQTYIFYSMNEFSTNIYQMLLSGVSVEQIEQALSAVAHNTAIIDDFKAFVQALNAERLLYVPVEDYFKMKDLKIDFAQKCDYKLSLLKFNTDSTCDLIQVLKGK